MPASLRRRYVCSRSASDAKVKATWSTPAVPASVGQARDVEHGDAVMLVVVGQEASASGCRTRRARRERSRTNAPSRGSGRCAGRSAPACSGCGCRDEALVMRRTPLPSGSGNDRVLDVPEAFDLDAYHVAGAQESRRLHGAADATRRAGGDHVAGLRVKTVDRTATWSKQEKIRWRGVRVLAQLAVHPGAQLEPVRIAASRRRSSATGPAGRACRTTCRASWSAP